MSTRVQQILEFITLAEKLKTEMRHSWTSNPARQESVAEHTWLMSLMAMSIIPELEIKVDPLKTIKMIIIHDLAEALCGDIPVHEKSVRMDNKELNEREALNKITSTLPNKELAEEIKALWEEFEKVDSPEARVARALDKIEVIIEHQLAGLDTWEEKEYLYCLYIKDYLYDFDKFMREFKDEVDRTTIKMIEEKKLENKLDPDEYKEFKRRNKL